jgi:hypothetical protein
MKGANAFDLAIDVEKAFQIVCEMSFCHHSQITESQALRKRYQNRNHELGISSENAMEFFTVTAWGEMPSFDRITSDFPNIVPAFSRLDHLRSRLSSNF